MSTLTMTFISCNTVVGIVVARRLRYYSTYGQRLKWCLVGSFHISSLNSERQFTTCQPAYSILQASRIDLSPFRRSNGQGHSGDANTTNALHLTHFCSSLELLGHSRAGSYHHHQITPIYIDRVPTVLQYQRQYLLSGDTGHRAPRPHIPKGQTSMHWRSYFI